jgi:MscS family membrane protein
MRMRGPNLLLALVFTTFATSAWAQQPSEPAPEPAAPEPATAAALADYDSVDEIVKPRVEDEVQGTCETPREVMLQLLYWVQEGTRVDKRKAAACMDTSAMADPERAPELAARLKTTLDVRGLYIDVDAIPKDPNHKDSSGRRRWTLPDLDDVVIVKKDGRWMFSAGTVGRIDALYADTIPPMLERVLSALPAWMHSTIGPIKVWQIFGVFLLIAIALILQKIVVYTISTYVRRFAGRVKVRWIDNAAGRVGRPIGGLAMAGVFYGLFPWLQFSVRVSQAARVATQVLAVFSLVWLGYRMIDVLTDWLGEKATGTDTKLDDQLVPMLRKVLKVFAVVIGGIFILQNLDVNVGSLLAGLGLGGLAFALAARDSIANIFGSLVIFIDKPFQIGDWIVIGDVEGVVEEVGFRTTRVRTFYNSQVTVPNAQMTNVSIDNYGRRQYRRYKTTLGLTYDTTPEKVQAFCEGVRAIISGLPGMRRDAYFVEFREFGPSSLDIFVYCFMSVADWGEELRTRTVLNLEILRLAQELGVSFAFPTRTLHLETRAEESEIPPHKPMTNADLVAAIDAFGPAGQLARPHGAKLSYGYHAGAAPAKGSDGNG